MGQVPSTSENFGDVLTPGFKVIFDETLALKDLPDNIADYFTVVPVDKSYLKYSSVGAYSDIPEYTGSITYQGNEQGYDTTINFPEYVSGFQIERKLFDDKEYNVMNGRPEEMANSVRRTRGKHAASELNEAFTTAPTDMDAVALCSASHPYSPSDSTTQSNTGTTAFSVTAVAATRLLMQGFVNSKGDKYETNMDMIIHPDELEEKVFEVINTGQQVDTANNNSNFHKGRYKALKLPYLTSTKNWFGVDSFYMKKWNIWGERVKPEFRKDQSSDAYILKCSTYSRWERKWVNWAWVYGHSVS